MESMGITQFYKNKKVLVTGHTGFKGSWLVLLLDALGAKVAGLSLDDAHEDGMYCKELVSQKCDDYFVDICDYNALKASIEEFKPDYVFHLAAESLVIRAQSGYLNTFNTNLIGTLNVVKICDDIGVSGLLISTTDKVYQNNDSGKIFSEDEPLGGDDVYSVSKSCIEFALNALRLQNSFSIQIATARAGNVIGGGDWAQDRLVPDLFRAHMSGQALILRNADSTRPWQHVLDPLFGYLIYMQQIVTKKKYEVSINFGPDKNSRKTVQEVVQAFALDCVCEIKGDISVKEKKSLFLSNRLASQELNWKPKLQFSEAIEWTKDWYQTFGNERISIASAQIEKFMRINKCNV